MNKLKLSGEIQTKEFVLRKTPEGVPVTSFLLKVKRQNKRNSKAFKDKYDIFTIVCWNDIAERVVETLKFGMNIYVEGAIQTGRRKLKGYVIYKDGKEDPNFQLPFCEVHAHDIRHMENL